MIEYINKRKLRMKRMILLQAGSLLTGLGILALNAAMLVGLFDETLAVYLLVGGAIGGMAGLAMVTAAQK